MEINKNLKSFFQIFINFNAEISYDFIGKGTRLKNSMCICQMFEKKENS